ncbi:hypothetical protein LI291_14305, partial [Intestinibacillus massiliensis]|nr:hypothetical protein [Intestinibacillus massiliensis]
MGLSDRDGFVGGKIQISVIRQLSPSIRTQQNNRQWVRAATESNGRQTATASNLLMNIHDQYLLRKGRFFIFYLE